MKFEKHIFICTNDRGENSSRKSCGACGGMEIRKEFVKMINEAGLKGKVRANKSGCLDVCEQGPALVVYPSGYWYLGIEEKDINRIFNESVLGDKPVQELVETFNQIDSDTEWFHKKEFDNLPEYNFYEATKGKGSITIGY